MRRVVLTDHGRYGLSARRSARQVPVSVSDREQRSEAVGRRCFDLFAAGYPPRADRAERDAHGGEAHPVRTPAPQDGCTYQGQCLVAAVFNRGDRCERLGGDFDGVPWIVLSLTTRASAQLCVG